jgi:hypothetical protein
MYADQVLKYRGPAPMPGQRECVNSYEHRNALKRLYTNPHGRALRAMLEGWARYADIYRDRYESSVGDDGVLGDEWAAIGRALYAMLCGELGGFDAGSLSTNIREILEDNGYTLED